MYVCRKRGKWKSFEGVSKYQMYVMCVNQWMYDMTCDVIINTLSDTYDETGDTAL